VGEAMKRPYAYFLLAVLVTFIVLAFIRFSLLDAVLLVCGVYLLMPQITVRSSK
jgi:hypothetical protein